MFYKIRKSDIKIIILNNTDDVDFIEYLHRLYHKDIDIFYVRINDELDARLRFGWNNYNEIDFNYFIVRGYEYCGDYISILRKEKLKRLKERESRR